MRKDALEPPKLRILTYTKGILHQRQFEMIYTGHCSWLCQERVYSFSIRLGTKSCHFSLHMLGFYFFIFL